MSYADARIDLSPVKVACLTGLNGAGKSALLDAITWALWDSARAPSDELVRLGQSEMWVDLCFSLDGKSYRIRRSRSKSYGRSGREQGGRGSLDLQIWDSDLPYCFEAESNGEAKAKGSDGKASDGKASDRKESNGNESKKSKPANSGLSAWRSLNANSMRETQKRLKELLHMDYQTFISSVYIRQGKADEFTTRSANERKQVLSDILGLDYFDRLQEMAREEARENKGRVQVLEANLLSRSDLDEAYLEAEKEIAEAEKEQSALSCKLQECVLQNDILKTRISELKYLSLKTDSMQTRMDEINSDLENISKRRYDLAERKKKLLMLTASLEQVLSMCRQFEECKSIAESLDAKSSKASDLNQKRLELRSRIAMRQGRLEVELEHLRVSFEAKQTRLSLLSKNLKDKEKIEESFNNYRKLLDAELEMSAKRETHTALSVRADELSVMISEARVRLDSEIQQKQQLLDELQELLAARHKILAEQELLKKALDEIEQHEAEFELVEERGVRIKSQIESFEEQIKQLKKQIAVNEEKVHELCESPDLSNCPLCRAPIVDSKAVLDRYEKDNKNTEAEILDIESQVGDLAKQRDLLRKQYVELRKKLSERKSIDMRIGEFNERQSALARAESTAKELSRELEACKQKLEENSFAPIEKESLIRVRAELAKLDFDPVVFSSFQAQMRSQRHIEMRYQQMQRELKEYAELEAELPILKEKIESCQAVLASGSFGGKEQDEIKALEISLAELAYDKSEHQEIKQKLRELLPFAEKRKEIERAELELPELLKELSEVEASETRKETELFKLREDLSKIKPELAQLTALESEHSQSEKIADELEQLRANSEKNLLLLGARLSQLEENRTEFGERRKLLQESTKAMLEYSLLAEAFGKKGIQAIIIENAIPEIEAEANRLLSRLTDNRMHLALVTQQRTKQGNPIETLDILIADELGTRAYELYSGGEAFKVNFALRVAMSRLLARRAGTRLETLIIDEGFGSQDELSRQKVIQAIASIKQDFAKIIVVSHIAEVKEMFPVQISISKEEGVSKVAVFA